MTDAEDLGFAVRDRGAYLPAADALVVADVHLGRDATSNVEYPLGERREIRDRLAALLETFTPAEVVLAGDVLHSFARVPRGVDEAMGELREAIEECGSELTVVEGNHDAMLDSIADPVAEHRLDDGETVVCHGHEEPSADAARYVIGHEHPAISIEGRRRPCFLYGEAAYRGADVFVLPSFNRLSAGTAVNRLRSGDVGSPLLEELDGFRPVVRADDETLVFPALGDLRAFL